MSEGGLLCTKQAARIVDSVLRLDAVQNLLCWLACFIHNRPPSPNFQIFHRQLRQMADRAVGLSIKSLCSCPRLYLVYIQYCTHQLVLQVFNLLNRFCSYSCRQTCSVYIICNGLFSFDPLNSLCSLFHVPDKKLHFFSVKLISV